MGRMNFREGQALLPHVFVEILDNLMTRAAHHDVFKDIFPNFGRYFTQFR